MKKQLLYLGALVLFSSCAKEEFAANKSQSTGSVTSALQMEYKLCSQHSLVKPKLDILLLWDNSTSAAFLSTAKKTALKNLLKQVALEKYDYNILNMPLLATQTTNQYLDQAVILTSGDSTLNSSYAQYIAPNVDSAIQRLNYTYSNQGGNEQGVSRAVNIIQANKGTNGLFRNDNYTIVVVMSNEDDKGCSSYFNLGNASCEGTTLMTDYKNILKKKLLCLRGNSSSVTSSECSSLGVNGSLNSKMFRFMNVSPITTCSGTSSTPNYFYKNLSRELYLSPYNNGNPMPADDYLNPVNYDSSNICENNTNMFNGVKTALVETVIQHKYNYWPVAGSSQTIDEESLRVVRSDGTVLTNRTGQSNTSSGYALLLDNSGDALNTTKDTRYHPTSGEAFSGKLIQLFGNDRVSYPDCLTVYYTERKTTYGYVYLPAGEPKIETLTLKYSTDGGSSYEIIPQSNSHGWSYLGLQDLSNYGTNSKGIVNRPSTYNTGYMLKLNGSYQMTNATNIKFVVDYLPAGI